MHDPVIKRPSECSTHELELFQTALNLASPTYAKWDGLRQRILNAEVLVFIPDENRFIATVALKRPMPHYKEKVFRLAGSPYSPDDYILELGWTYVDPSVRVRGVATKMNALAASLAGKYTIYGIVHDDSWRIVDKLGFEQTGNPYQSHFYTSNETLWVQPPGSYWNTLKERFCHGGLERS